MISYNGFNSMVITMPKSSEVSGVVGKPVKLDTNGKVVLAAKDNDFVGICVADRGEYATVQVQGYTECTYTGTAPQHGWARITANGDGKVLAASGSAGAPTYRVISVDTTGKTVGFIL